MAEITCKPSHYVAVGNYRCVSTILDEYDQAKLQHWKKATSKRPILPAKVPPFSAASHSLAPKSSPDLRSRGYAFWPFHGTCGPPRYCVHDVAGTRRNFGRLFSYCRYFQYCWWSSAKRADWGTFARSPWATRLSEAGWRPPADRPRSCYTPWWWSSRRCCQRSDRFDVGSSFVAFSNFHFPTVLV